jgi:hypothetical protein
MFTNEQIRTAMEGLVKQKGENHTSIGLYTNALTGKGECFLGSLCEYMGYALPKEGTRARDVLGVDGVSVAMGNAFQVAQSLNDSRYEWKYVLLGVDLAMGVSPMIEAVICPCGCGISQNYQPIVDEVKRQRDRDKGMEYATRNSLPQSFATGGYITGAGQKVTIDLSELTGTMNSLTYSLDSLSASFGAFTTSYAGAPVAKKDHALVA